MQDTAGPVSGFRRDIEGLRAVAVVAVVLFHAQVPGVGGGFVGVDVFFVISGFLITGLLWREVSSSGGVRLGRFWGARARRLLPASALVGVVTAVGSVVLLPPLQAVGVLGDGIASALYVSNYRFALQLRNYFDAYLPPSPFEHYWSLGVEEQFYLVWPVLMIATAWVVRRVRRRGGVDGGGGSRRPYVVVLVVVAVVSFGVSLAATYVVPSVAFFSLPTRAWELAVGGLVALSAGWWSRLPGRVALVVGWVGLGLIVVGCLVLGPTTPFPGTAALLSVGGAALVIGAGCAVSDRGCVRVLALAPMQALGRVSYSWYLWHWPVLLLAPALVGHGLGLGARLVAVLVSLGLAVLTLRFVENPLRFAVAVRGSARASLGLGAGVTAVAVGVCVALLVWLPAPVGRGAPAVPLLVTAAPTAAGADQAAVRASFAQVQAAVAASVDLTAVPSNLTPPLADAAAQLDRMFRDGCMRNFFQAGQPECVAGDPASDTTVALIGDSHAAMWTPAFKHAADQQHWRLEMLTRAGCPMLDQPITNPLRRMMYTDCEQWRDQIITRLRAERPQLIALSMWRGYGPGQGFTSGFDAYDPSWIDSLTDLVRQLRDTGAKVLVLGPIPDPHLTARICLSAHLDDATACSAPRSMAVNQAGIDAEAAATKAAGGQYVDLTDLFCTPDRCPVIVGNTLVYVDQYHLSIEYSQQLAPVMAALADRALAAG